MAKASKKYQEIIYEKSFLREVIARIDFVSPITKLDKEFPRDISNGIRAVFPIVETKEAKIDEFEVSKEGTRKRKQVQFTSWEFLAKNRKNKLVVNRNALFVSYKKYERYETTRNDFLMATRELAEVFPNVQARRLGLRYINEIELPESNPLDWRDYLHSKTVSLLRYFPDTKYTCRVISILEYNFGDYMIRCQFGMPNPDYPAPIIKKIFVLDFDAHTDEQQDIAHLETPLDEFHFAIQDLFEKSIKDGLRERMND